MRMRHPFHPMPHVLALLVSCCLTASAAEDPSSIPASSATAPAVARDDAKQAAARLALSRATTEVEACERQINTREKHIEKARGAVTAAETDVARFAAARKRLDDANAAVAKQRRRASAASIKEQEDAQKAFNELKRAAPLEALESQVAAARKHLEGDEKSLAKLTDRLSDLQGKRAEAEKALKAFEAGGGP